MSATDYIHQHLLEQASPTRAALSRSFFKTNPGDYGDGNQFLGLTVPQIRALLPETDALCLEEVLVLLHSVWHEERLLALLIIVRRFEKARNDVPTREEIVKLYLENLPWVNNWDLVDSSAPHVLGTWLLTHDRSILDELAASSCLWEQRAAIVATLTLIRNQEFDDTLRLCAGLISHPHHLIHKACGWMLREIGRRDEIKLSFFLDRYAVAMPRTMLRYALEKLPQPDRRHYMNLRRMTAKE